MAAFTAADIGIMIGTGKDIIQHTTGIDIWGPIVDFILGPDAEGGDDAAAAAADPLVFLALALIAIGMVGYWMRTRRD